MLTVFFIVLCVYSKLNCYIKGTMKNVSIAFACVRFMFSFFLFMLTQFPSVFLFVPLFRSPGSH